MTEQQNKAIGSGAEEPKAIGSGTVEQKAIGSGAGAIDKNNYFEKIYGIVLISLASLGLFYIAAIGLVALIMTLNIVSAWMELILFLIFGSGIFVLLWSIYYLRWGIKMVKQAAVPKRKIKSHNITIMIMAALQIWLGTMLLQHPDDTLFMTFGFSIPIGIIFVIYGLVIIPMAAVALYRSRGLLLEW